MKMFLVKVILLIVLFRLAYKYRYRLMNLLLSIKFIRRYIVAQSMKMPFPSGFLFQSFIS
ncbi:MULTISPECIES: hypothetical protein [Bacillus]|uniref:hypothetical protein n=1 Tax=Bacillus TaxID=1386 RepID=UPI0002DED428|nr:MULTISPECIES: hypothetical protein [Bacillus]